MGTQRMTLLEYCEQNTQFTYLLKEWDYEKNKDLTPANVGFRANKRVWWKLPYDDERTGKHFDFEWETRVADRAKGSGCPFLLGRLWTGFNDLSITHPHFAEQWHPTKNLPLTPQTVLASAHLKVWWQYKFLNEHTGEIKLFEWEAFIDDRTKKNSLKPRIVKDFEKELSLKYGSRHQEQKREKGTISEELIKQWHPTLNGKLKPEMITATSTKKVWWLFPYDVPLDYPIKHLRGKHFDFEWQCSVKQRIDVNGCPFLSGHSVWKGFNDLETVHPTLAAQWHPAKNGNLKPCDVSVYSSQKVWWLLPYDVPMDYPIEHLRGKHFDFEWKAFIHNRTSGATCPYIAKSNPKVWVGFNDFATTHPELSKEWHPTKNGSLTPQDVSHGYRYNVWWFLSHDDPVTGKHHDYEWEARIPDRINKNRGCPFLHNSFGEQQVTEILDKYFIRYKPQYKFPDRKRDLKFAQPLRDDFAILDENNKPIATIEYNGQQHYYPISFRGEDAEKAFNEIQERDALKKKYLDEHNIPQLVIPYWDYDNIENIVVEFLKELNIL